MTGKRQGHAEFAMGVRYQQQSGEVRALQLQAFRIATERLDAAVAENGGPQGLAVVTDLDETVLDNSPLFARALADGRHVDDWRTWKHWEREGQPQLTAGSADFLHHADRAGVAIFYMSDRWEENKDATIATLQALKLPQARADRVLLLGEPKQGRRAWISERFRIILQLGDSLHDFDHAFAEGDPQAQRRMVADNADRFGRDWIIVPNAGHGRWTEAELTAWDIDAVIED